MKSIKHIALYFGLTVLGFSFSNCGGSINSAHEINMQKNPPFQIANAYMQEWVAGIEVGGSGTVVYIILESIDDDVAIEEIYFHKKIKKLEHSKEVPLHYMASFNNDIGRDIIMDDDPVKEAQNVPPRSFSYKLETNEAILTYTQKGVLKYYKLSQMDIKEVISYPSKPNNNE